MIKRTLNPPATAERPEADWLRLADFSEVEITSESAAHPIEAALAVGDERGWEAATAGTQTILLHFQPPRPVRQVRIVVEERERERTQQFVLRAAANREGPWRELVRQQFNFSPGGSTREQEDYHLDLPTTAALELTIVPDLGGGLARATLQQLRVT